MPTIIGRLLELPPPNANLLGPGFLLVCNIRLAILRQGNGQSGLNDALSEIDPVDSTNRDESAILVRAHLTAIHVAPCDQLREDGFCLFAAALAFTAASAFLVEFDSIDGM